jgi:hypothetical protein
MDYDPVGSSAQINRQRRIVGKVSDFLNIYHLVVELSIMGASTF